MDTPEPKGIGLEAAIAVVKLAMRKDPDYAWSWHCAVAVCMQDEGVSHAVSNRGAVRFMRMAFGVDTAPSLKKMASPQE
jgi:hypothetical protein